MTDAGLYHDPEIYDILHWPGTVQEVRGLARIEKRWAPPSGQQPSIWLEPACGTGRLLIEAARQAREQGDTRQVVGFDLNAAMVGFASAKAKALSISKACRFFTGDMRRFAHELEPASVSLAFNPINTIRHLMSDAATLDHFAEIAKVLRPGGIYAVGLSVCDPSTETPTEDVWEGRRTVNGHAIRVKQIVQYEPAGWLRANGRRCPARRELVSSHLVITGKKGRGTPDAIEHRDDAYWLRTYTRAQWTHLIERSALHLIASVDESGAPHDPGTVGYAIWLLGRRG